MDDDPVREFLVEDSDEEIRRRRLRFVGTIVAEPDLSARTDEYLQGFGEDWSPEPPERLPGG